MQHKAIIFLDGKELKPNSRLLESMRPGILNADGPFETMLCVKGKILFFDEHLNRLAKALRILKIIFPLSKIVIKKQVHALLKKINLKTARVRLSVWRKNHKNHFAIVIEEYQLVKKPYHVLISKYIHPGRPAPDVKSLKYKVFYKAYQQAHARNYDEAILLNSKKEIVEGSRTNIFIMRNNNLFTPPLSSGCLNGLFRRRIINLARRLKIKFQEKRIILSDLFNADEILLSNSLIGVVSVSCIDCGDRVLKFNSKQKYQLINQYFKSYK